MQLTAKTLLGLHYKMSFHNKMCPFCIFLCFSQKRENIVPRTGKLYVKNHAVVIYLFIYF